MNSQRDLMERLSVFSDQLSEEAKAAFEADLCGVIAYAGGPISSLAARAFDYDPHAGQDTFADSFYHAWRRSLDGLLLPVEREAEALTPIGSRKLAAFIGWVMQNCGAEIEAEVMRDPSPITAVDTTIINATRDIASRLVAVEPNSKGEMRLSASIPAGLSLTRVRTLLAIAPDAPLLKLGFSLMDRALPQAAKQADRVQAVCRAVQQVAASPLKPAAKTWFYQMLAQRSAQEGDIVLAALALHGKNAAVPIEASPYAPLIDAALASFDARVERVTGHVASTGDQPLSHKGLLELTGTTQLGHTLWSNVEFETCEAWSKRFGAARRKLRDVLAPRLPLGQPSFERLLVSTVARNGEPMKMAMEQAPLFMAEFALIRSRPDVFAANTPVRSEASKVVGMFEMGLPRLFERITKATGEERSNLVARMRAALAAADTLFADNYTRMMRERLERELRRF
ncbi:MAG: hypothetical protein AAF737_08215 [Pseudomonadota bacterium]